MTFRFGIQYSTMAPRLWMLVVLLWCSCGSREALPSKEVHSLNEQVTRYLYAMGHHIMISLDDKHSHNEYHLSQARDELGYILPHLITKFDAAYLKATIEERDSPRRLSRGHIETAEIQGLKEYVNTLQTVATMQGLPELTPRQEKLLGYLEGAVLSGFGVYMIRVGKTLQYYSCEACKLEKNRGHKHSKKHSKRRSKHHNHHFKHFKDVRYSKNWETSCPCQFNARDLPPERVDDIAEVVTNGYLTYYEGLVNIK